jgi:hypothetical protein
MQGAGWNEFGLQRWALRLFKKIVCNTYTFSGERLSEGQPFSI